MQQPDNSWIPILAVVVIVLLIAWYVSYKRRISSSWKGVVIDKNSQTRGGFASGTGTIMTISALKVKTDTGKEITLRVTSGVYEDFKIGDKIIKKAGDSEPVKP